MRYAAPRLYLDSTPLAIGSYVLTSGYVGALRSKAGRPVRGVLGMDCLKHYCIRMDFKAGRIRFLDPRRVSAARLGKAFPLMFSTEGQTDPRWVRPYVHSGCFVKEQDADLLVDTGHTGDGTLQSELFREGLREQTRPSGPDANDGQEPKSIYLSRCVWNGDSYRDISLGKGGAPTEPGKG